MMKLQVKAGLILSFFLCMEAGFCVNAQEPVFEKDKGVYLIQSAEDMRTLALLVNRGKEVEPGVAANSASYRLTRDIDLSAYCTGEEGWEPIGYRDTDDESMQDVLWEINENTGREQETNAGYFNGIFDGGNHVVTGLYINRLEKNAQGLFGGRRNIDLRKEDADSTVNQSRKNTAIRNLYVKDCDIRGDYGVGGIMGGGGYGWKEGGNLSIENCHVTGKIVGDRCAGGIAGQASTIKNCSFTGTVEAYKAGGIAGNAYYIYGCAVHAKVEGDESVGGVGGDVSCVRNSYVHGSVSGYVSVGGISGSGACLTGCYSMADVTGYRKTGGLIGNAGWHSSLPTPEGSSNAVSIKNCLMGGYRMEATQEIREEIENCYNNDVDKEHYYNGYICGFLGRNMVDLPLDPFYYREGLVMEGFHRGFYDYPCFNSFPYDCTHLEETDFKDLLARPEEKWSDVWFCAADYAWPILAWEKNSRFGYTVTVTVQEGDSLWEIADAVYGDGHFWTQIYEENKERIGKDVNLVLPGTDLEITVNASQADYAAEGAVKEQEKEFLEEGKKRGITAAECKDIYRRLLADDLWNGQVLKWNSQTGKWESGWGFWLSDWTVTDLDENGQADMVVMVGENRGISARGTIWLYLNEEPAYILKDGMAYDEERFCFDFHFWEGPWMADVDNDGREELLLAAFNGGNGGPGGRDTCLMRRVGDAWESCLEELPNDYGEWGEAQAGLWVQVACTGVDRYEAYCPYLDERIEFDGKNSREIGEDEYGRVAGSNVRGFYDYKCVPYKGKNALQCRECLCGEGGNAHGVGEAVFILTWDADGVCRVADWRIEGWN